MKKKLEFKSCLHLKKKKHHKFKSYHNYQKEKKISYFIHGYKTLLSMIISSIIIIIIIIYIYIYFDKISFIIILYKQWFFFGWKTLVLELLYQVIFKESTMLVPVSSIGKVFWCLNKRFGDQSPSIPKTNKLSLKTSYAKQTSCDSIIDFCFI